MLEDVETIPVCIPPVSVIFDRMPVVQCFLSRWWPGLAVARLS